MNRGIWVAVLVCLSGLAIACLWFPIERTSAFIEVNYNEGWNSYRQQMAAQGSMLYALPPDLAATNYPPLSFHLIGFLGKLTGDMTSAGRWVSLLALLAVALQIAFLTHSEAGRWGLGVYAAILFLIWLAALAPDRVGMNDPQLLGMVFSVLGVCLYVRNPKSNRALLISAVAFTLGLSIKHNLIAFPAAVFLHLLISRAPRRLGFWLASMAFLGGISLLLAQRWDGQYFWMHLMTPRDYSWLTGWVNISAYMVRCQIAFAAALFWSIWNMSTGPRNSFLAISFALANAIGFWFAGGDGVDKNVLFDALVVLAVITAVAVGELEPLVLRLRFGKALLPVLLAAPALGSLTLLPAQLRQDKQMAAVMTELESERLQAVDLLKARPGPALCESLLLCYEAGKPMLYDAFYVDSQLKIGLLAEDKVVRMIEGGQFRTIEMELVAGETLQPAARHRFSANIMRAITEHYQPKMRATVFAILSPRDEP